MEFLFDTRNLSYVGAGMALAAFLILLLCAWLIKQREWGFVLWIWGAGFTVFGQIFGSLRAALGSSFGAVIANVSFVFAIIMVVRGARFFAGQDTSWRMHLSYVGIIAAVSLATLYASWPDVWRPVVFAALQALLFGELFWVLLRRMPPALRTSARLLAVACVAMISTFGCYAWAAVRLAQNPRDPLAASLVSGSFLLASSLPLLLVLGFVFMQKQSLRAKAPPI